MKKDKLNLLCNYLKKNNYDAMIIPSNDAFQSEYVPAHSRRLEWLTGFTGSNGIAIVFASGKAAFFTDGRYTIQAQAEVPPPFDRYNMADLKPWEWLAKFAVGKTVYYDPWLHTEDGLKPYNENSLDVKPFKINPIDVIWEDKPAARPKPIVNHDLRYSGKSREDKIKDILQVIKKNKADYLLITAPDSICWLLNIRGSDVPYSPLVLSYALMDKTGSVDVFAESAEATAELKKQLGKKVSVNKIDTLINHLNKLKNNKILYDKSNAPVWFTQTLSNSKLEHSEDPCQLAKAIKNDVEIAGTKQAHIRDGAALTKSLKWISNQLIEHKAVKETDIASVLVSLRSEQKLFKEPSFGTIAGFNANGAIVHYQAKERGAATLDRKPGSMLLLDSGGQYLDGTTDITRTIALGKPSKEQKKHFTLVLKGHIALATAIFPVGTSGSALDVLARQYLWECGLDYDHGTGHGVGSFLGVHEGPQRISKLPNKVALRPGMILSNEPGYYKTGEYGIRIESLVLVVPHAQYKNFLCFETISRAPIDTQLIEKSLLTEGELMWLTNYHKQVISDISPLLTAEEKKWLEQSMQLD